MPLLSDTGVVGGIDVDIIAPPPGELFPETNDNSVTILLNYATARILLACDAKARKEEHSPAVRTRGPKRSSTFRNYTHSEPRFRALLAEGASEVELALVQRLRSRAALLTNYRQMTEADFYEKSTTELVGEHRPTLLSGLQFRAMLTKSGSERVELACFSPAR